MSVFKSINQGLTEKEFRPKKTGPIRLPQAISLSLEKRIIWLKEKYPAWGTWRIKHQFNFLYSLRTAHRILRKPGLLNQIKAKLQPTGKRFQQHNLDSMWQGILSSSVSLE